MRIFYPHDGIGCRVVVGEGFFDGFNDDHPESNLHGLLGATFSFDDDFQLIGIRFNNGDAKGWEGPHLKMVAAILRDWAQEQKPPKISGFRPALRLPTPETAPPAVESLEELEAELDKVDEAPPSSKVPYQPIPREEDPTYTYEKITPTVIVRRKRAG